MAFPGSVTIKTETLLAFVRDILDSMRRAGFRRVRRPQPRRQQPRQAMAQDWMGAPPEMSVHTTGGRPPKPGRRSWRSTRSLACLVDGELPVDAARQRRPAARGKPVIDRPDAHHGAEPGARLSATATTAGFQRADEEMQMIWDVAVDETRALMLGGWR
jgi:creatinine amidohydrolase